MNIKSRSLVIFLYASIAFSQQGGLQDTAYIAVVGKAAGSLPQGYLESVFSDPAVTVHQEIADRFAKPYEAKPWKEYRAIFITEPRIQGGIDFHNENRETVHAIAKKYGLDEYLIISILGVESNYGYNHGQYSVFNALYTQIHIVPRRTNWAAAEMVKYLKFCYEDSIDPQTIRGSYAGAFGLGQFIPSSYTAYAEDYNNDGVRDPFDTGDALASIAHYLKQNGFVSRSRDYTRKSKNWKAIYAYNHSENYVNVIIELRNEIKKGVEQK